MAEIEEQFTMSKCIAAIETMCEELAKADATTSAVETQLTPVSDSPDGSSEPVYYGLKMMGGSIPELGVAAVRINSDIIHWPEHPESGERVRDKLPAANGRYTAPVLVFSTETGEPLLVYPDGFVQSHRVAATSAIGAKYLARDNATKLGLLGAGQQARAHTLALDAVCELETINVYSPTAESRRKFAAELDNQVDATVTAVDQSRTVFADADIVQCATNATAPVFDPAWLEPGTHIGLIRHMEAPNDFWTSEEFDAFAQDYPRNRTQKELVGEHLHEREMPTRNWTFYVAEGEQSVPRFEGNVSRESIIDWENVPGIGEIILGEASGRSNDDGISVFYTGGSGAQFAAAGKVLLELAEEHDLGRSVSTDLFTQKYHP